MRNRIVGAVVVVVVLIAGFFAFRSVAAPSAAPTPTQTTAQTKTTTLPTVSAEGQVVPIQSATLAFKIGGRIVAIPVQEGDTVKAGAVLARLDDALLQAQVAQAQAAYAAAQTQLVRVKASNAAQIEIAQAQLARLKAGATPEELAVAKSRAQEAATALAQTQDSYDRLSWVGGPTEVQLRSAVDRAGAANRTAQLQFLQVQAGARPEDIAVAQVQLDLAQGDAGKAEVQAAQDQVDQTQAALAVAQAAARDAVLTAPFDGTVAIISVDTGQVVAAGAPAISFGDLSKLQVETTDLAEVDVAKVAVGQAATVTLDALPGKTFQGQVVRIAPEANDHRGDQVYKVTIDLPDASGAGARWGMTANVEIATAK